MPDKSAFTVNIFFWRGMHDHKYSHWQQFKMALFPVYQKQIHWFFLKICYLFFKPYESNSYYQCTRVSYIWSLHFRNLCRPIQTKKIQWDSRVCIPVMEHGHKASEGQPKYDERCAVFAWSQPEIRNKCMHCAQQMHVTDSTFLQLRHC
jgi:hypothetical protein